MKIVKGNNKRTIIYLWGGRFLAAAGPFKVSTEVLTHEVLTQVLFEIVGLVHSLDQTLQKEGLFPYPFGVAWWLLPAQGGYYFLMQGGPELDFLPPSPPAA